MRGRRVGKGYRTAEFNGFCIPPEEAGERFDEAIVHAWRDVTPESTLQTSSFGTFMLMRLYSEAGQFSDLEQQVDD